MKTTFEYLSQAKNFLSGNWKNVIITTIVYMVVACAVSFGSSAIGEWASPFSMLVSIPLGYGFNIIFLKYFRTSEDIEFSELFQAFNGEQYLRVLGTMLLEGVLIFLGFLLLFVPGVIWACAYAIVPFILKDHPELSYMNALRMSKEMMEGHKMQYFCISLVATGLGILSIFTFCIALLWVVPFVEIVVVAFYEDIKAEHEGKVVNAAVID